MQDDRDGAASRRQVRYSVAMSLDGYIAGPNGEFDWIVPDPDIDFAALYADIDTALMGRKTYELVRSAGEAGAMPGVRIYVFSHSLRPEDCPGARLSRDVEATVRELREQPGKNIWLFGGGALFRSMLELDLVDIVEVGVIPILLGGGIPLLPPPASSKRLKLVEQRLYEKTGALRLRYAVERRR